MTKTAVEWLVEKLDNNLDIKHSWRTEQYIEQAKQKEKQEKIKIINNVLEHSCLENFNGTIEQYYEWIINNYK